MGIWWLRNWIMWSNNLSLQRQYLSGMLIKTNQTNFIDWLIPGVLKFILFSLISVATWLWFFYNSWSFYFNRFVLELQNYDTIALSFYRSQNVLCRSNFFEPAQKIWMNLVPLKKLLCMHKKQFYWMQIILLSGTIFK